jgi:hypothetical protein
MCRSLILALVVILSLLTTAWAGTCLNGGTSKSVRRLSFFCSFHWILIWFLVCFNLFEVPSTTTYCPQYYRDTCCDASFVEFSCSAYDGCRRLPGIFSSFLRFSFIQIEIIDYVIVFRSMFVFTRTLVLWYQL